MPSSRPSPSSHPLPAEEPRSGRTRSAKAARTRARILKAALRLFRRGGYDATGMRDVARQAGTSLGSAYYYFASKDELVLEWYRQLQGAAWQDVDAIVRTHARVEDRLVANAELAMRRLRPHRRLLAALIRSGIDPTSPVSPFGAHAAAVRLEAQAQFHLLLAGADLKLANDLSKHIARVTWLLHLGLLLLWTFDGTPGQRRTRSLMPAVYSMFVALLRLQRVPPAARLMRRAFGLLDLFPDG